MTTARSCHDRHQRPAAAPLSPLEALQAIDSARAPRNGPGEAQSVVFRVEGLAPAPQGSKRHVGNGRMVESSARVKPWREAVRTEALATGFRLTDQPVYLHLLFRFRRPQGHYGAKGTLRPSAPVDVVTRPDLDKLCRSTLDALTGTLIRDDSQVVFLVASKEYTLPGELEGAQIELRIMRNAHTSHG